MNPLRDKLSMKPGLAILAGCLIFFGCSSGLRESLRITPVAERPSFSPYTGLKRAIDAMLPDSLFPPSNAMIRVVSIANGEVLYDLNGELLANPASNQKLFTTAAALAELGEGYRLTTGFAIDTGVAPTLFIKGGGDPLLSTDDIDSVAGVLSTILPPGRCWRLTGDVSMFDDVSWGAGWAWDFEPDRTGMYISPLSLNSNTIEVQIEPGPAAGAPARVTTNPPTSYVSVENACTTVADSVTVPLVVSRKWRERSNIVTVDGQVRLADSPATRTISVWQPEWYTLTVLKESLARRGIAVSGMVLDTIPAGARTVISFSHPLDTVVSFMNHFSDNLSAENLLKIMGASKFGFPGTADEGIAVVKDFLASRGIDTTRMVIADGSGVSRYNLTSPAAVDRLLQVMAADRANFNTFENSLPVAGERGYLSSRMKGTPAEHNVHAKTGTLQGVSTLSGYVRTADGELLAFSIFLENFPDHTSAYRRVQDRIAAYLAGLRRSAL